MAIQRLGPSLYIDDIKMLIDTPEDIAVACNRQRISEVKHLSISHSDPDHVRGIRIVEKIGCDFIKGTSMPIGFYALPEVIRDINPSGAGLRRCKYGFRREYGTVEVGDRLCLPHDLDIQVSKLHC